MKSIKIHDKAYVNGLGHRINGNCKPIVIKELNLPFDSVTEAAEFLKVTVSSVSSALNGNTQTVGGYHVFFAKEITKNLDDVLAYNRNESKRKDKELAERKMEIATLREKAALWEAHLAEREAARKAKEMEHQRLLNNVQSAREELENNRNLIQHLDSELQKAVAANMVLEQAEHDAEMELLKFEGKAK